MELSKLSTENGLIRSHQKIVRQYRGAGQYAVIELLIDPQAEDYALSFQLPQDTYEKWKDGAIAGMEYALKMCGRQTGHIIITQLEGTTVDTSPASIAEAAMYALWNALVFEPSDELREHIKQVVHESRGTGMVPTF